MIDRPSDAGESSRPETLSAGPMWQRAFVLQLVITALGVVALQALRPMVTYRAIGLDASPVEIGLVQSAFSVIPAIFAVSFGRLVDRHGEVPILSFGMAMVAIGAAVSGLSHTLLVLAIGQVVTGLGDITHIVASQALVANRGPRAERDARYGWYATTVSIGQLVGPLVGAAIVGGTVLLAATSAPVDEQEAYDSVSRVFYVAAAAATAALILSRWLARLPAPARAPLADLRIDRASAFQVLKRPGMPAAMFVSIVAVSTTDVLVAYLPAHGVAHGLSVQVVGTLLAIRALSTLVSRLFMVRLIRIMGREWLLAASLLMAACGILALPFIEPIPVLYAAMVVIGLGVGFGQPMTLAWVANRSLRRERGLALGVRLTGNRAALLIVPTAMGVLAGAAGINAIWVALSAALGTGAIVARRTPFDELAAEPPVGDPPRASSA